MEKPLAGSNPMLHFQIRTPSTGVRPPTTLFHGLLAYWRSRSGYEVDFILDDRVAIEAQSTRRVQQKHLRSLRALAEERLVERSIVVCREDRPRIEDGIEIWPLEFFLAALWNARL